jgi:hypothetical protein
MMAMVTKQEFVRAAAAPDVAGYVYDLMPAYVLAGQRLREDHRDVLCSLVSSIVCADEAGVLPDEVNARHANPSRIAAELYALCCPADEDEVPEIPDVPPEAIVEPPDELHIPEIPEDE